jgi:CheY-like chemotaxis protein
MKELGLSERTNFYNSSTEALEIIKETIWQALSSRKESESRRIRPIKLILSDFKMPGISGVDMIKGVILFINQINNS